VAVYNKLGDDTAATSTVLSTFSWQERNVRVADLTIDGNAKKWSALVSVSFVQPSSKIDSELGSGETNEVWVTVDHPDVFTPYIGRSAVLQDDLAFDGSNPTIETTRDPGFDHTAVVSGRVYGTYLIVATDATRVKLKNVSALGGIYGHIDRSSYQENDEGFRYYVDKDGEIASGKRLMLQMQMVGIVLTGFSDLRVENVHVMNTCVNEYEATSGIAIAGVTFDDWDPGLFSGDDGSGNVIRDCLVDNIWGPDGSGIGLLCGDYLGVSEIKDIHDPNNLEDDEVTGYTNRSAGTVFSGTIENNVVRGSGFTQHAYGFSGQYIVFRNNYASDCANGFYSDVGLSDHVNLTQNRFENVGWGFYLGGGGYQRSGVQPSVAPYVYDTTKAVPGNAWSYANVTNNSIAARRLGIRFGGFVRNSSIRGNAISLARSVTPGSYDGGIIIVEGHPGVPSFSSVLNTESENVTPSKYIPVTNPVMVPGYQ
jgi:hypothetical protein